MSSSTINNTKSLDEEIEKVNNDFADAINQVIGWMLNNCIDKSSNGEKL